MRRVLIPSLSSIGLAIGSHSSTDCASAPIPDDLKIERIVSNSQYRLFSPLVNKDPKGESFVVIYDNKTRCPQFVIEKLINNYKVLELKPSEKDKGFFDFEEAEKKALVKRPPFFADLRIESDHFRVQPKDYTDSKYDRGHMVPAADFTAHPSLYEGTFTMSNICPQAPLLNQGFWARFEAWIRHYLLRHVFDEVFVITGPVFAPTFIDNKWVFVHRTIGTFPRLIPVPTHFYKVIIGRKYSTPNNLSIGAFLVPNVDTINKSEPLVNFVVRLDQLESMIGFKFLPNEMDDKEREKLDVLIPEWREMSTILNSRVVNKSSGSLTWQDLGDPKNNVNLLVPANNKHNFVNRSKATNLGKFLHLCESGVDCNKSLFDKSDKF